MSQMPEDEPAFILGLPRSGTTLLSYALNTHPEITVPPEPWLLLALDALGQASPQNPVDSVYLGRAFEEFTAGCDLGAAKRAFALHIYRQHLRRSGKRVFVDKTPRYWLMLAQIREMFPDARYVWLRRNPFAVLASMKSSWGFDLMKQLARGGDHLHLFDLLLGSRALSAFAARPPCHLLSVGYERLVDDPVRETARVFDFLGVRPFTIDPRIDAANAAYASSRLGDKRIVQTSTYDKTRSDAWRGSLSAEEKNALFDLLGPDLIAAFGYPEIAGEFRANRDEKRQWQVTAELSNMVEGAFQARQLDIRRFCSPDQFDPATGLAVQLAYRYPQQVLEAFGVTRTNRPS